MEAIDEIIRILNIQHYVIKDDELGCLCLNPEHNDEKLGNFYINIKTGMYNCFSCGFRGNVINLLYTHGASYTQALKLWKYIQLDRREDIILPAKALDKYRMMPYLKQVSPYALQRVGSGSILEDYGVYADENGNPIFTTRNLKQEYTFLLFSYQSHHKYMKF